MKWNSDNNTRLNTLQFIENEKSYIQSQYVDKNNILKENQDKVEKIKSYTSKCYFMLKTQPYWYNESLTFNINSTKRNYKEIVYFKDKLVPYYWSETLFMDLTPPNYKFNSEMNIPIEDIQYIPLTTA